MKNISAVELQAAFQSKLGSKPGSPGEDYFQHIKDTELRIIVL